MHKSIAFRDLLRRDEAARAKYLEVKLSAARVAEGWDDYTRSKDAVVAGLLADNVPRNAPVEFLGEVK